MSKLLSQGSFGCVYYPSLSCKGKPEQTKDYLSKLQKKDFNSENEKLIGKKIIKNIPDYKKHFVPILSYCDINLSEIDSKELSKCNVVSKNETMRFELQKMKYVQSSLLFSFIDNSSNPRKIIFNMIELYSFIIHSIEILANNQIVHFDLKNDNILFSLQARTPLLIDFGISIDMDKLLNPLTRSQYLDNYFYVYAPQYYVWPLEVHFINYLVHVKPTANLEEIRQLCKKYVTENRGLDVFSENFKKEYYKRAVQSLSKYADYTSKDTVIAELIQHYKTWDNYSISILYLRILYAIFQGKYPNNSFIVSFSELLTLNIHPNPLKRKSLRDSLKIFHKLFYNSKNPENYMKLLTNFSFDRKIAMKSIKADDTALEMLYNKHKNNNFKKNKV